MGICVVCGKKSKKNVHVVYLICHETNNLKP